MSNLDENFKDAFERFKDSEAMTAAFATLLKAQKNVHALPDKLKEAGISAKDPISVGVYVEVATAFEEQAHAERNLILQTFFYYGTLISDKLQELSSQKGTEDGPVGNSN